MGFLNKKPIMKTEGFHPIDLSEANVQAMQEALSRVHTSEITYAARDSDFDGFEINEGDYLALEEGKLFGAVTGKEIAAALKEQYGMDVDSKKLVLDQPIKTFGSFEVKAKLGYEVSARFSVSVSEE